MNKKKNVVQANINFRIKPEDRKDFDFIRAKTGEKNVELFRRLVKNERARIEDRYEDIQNDAEKRVEKIAKRVEEMAEEAYIKIQNLEFFNAKRQKTTEHFLNRICNGVFFTARMSLRTFYFLVRGLGIKFGMSSKEIKELGVECDNLSKKQFTSFCNDADNDYLGFTEHLKQG